MSDNNFVYTEDQLMARLRFFIGCCLAMTLTGIVFVVLYSLIFVTQPLNAISPIDQKFFELIVPIATFLTGTLSGIMLAGGDKESQKKALDAANRGWTQQPPPTPPAPAPVPPSSFGGGLGVPSMGTFGMPQSAGFPERKEPVLGFPGAAPQTPQVITGFGGKPAPAPMPQPEI